jgi:hypothetical protein
MIIPMLLDIDEFNNHPPHDFSAFWTFPEIPVGHAFLPI